MVLCNAGRDRRVLTQQLRRLGMMPTSVDVDSDLPQDSDFNVAFVDVDSGRLTPQFDQLCEVDERPVLALIGSDAPSSVNWALEQGACGYLVKPIRGTGILASLVLSCHAFEERRANARALADLQNRLKARQVVCSAALRILDGFGQITEHDAFQILRLSSMARRITVEDLSAMIMSGELPLSALQSDISARKLKSG